MNILTGQDRIDLCSVIDVLGRILDVDEDEGHCPGDQTADTARDELVDVVLIVAGIVSRIQEGLK